MKYHFARFRLSALAIVAMTPMAFAQDASPKPNKFTDCVAAWNTKKAAPGYEYKKGGYREHMGSCLRDPNSKAAARRGA